MDKTLELLKDLSEAHGVAGYETPVRTVIHKYLEKLGGLSQDKLGSVICTKKGSSAAPRVMLVAHMDEIGFMVKRITKEGFLKFLQLGGWWDQTLLGQRVIVKTKKGDLVGVIAAKPIHLLKAEQRKKVVEKKDMYIDVGAVSKEEVEKLGVRQGDPIVPRADFVQLAPGNTYLGKAFDDRVGLTVMISALQNLCAKEHPNSVFAVATVQEEVGARGAYTSVSSVQPDVAIILEADIAGDVPGITADQSEIKLGKGPSIYLYDARMIPNIKLRDLVRSVADELAIPLQFSFLEGGATDGFPIHLYKTGVPTIVLAVPARHIHSHSSIIHRKDCDSAVQLLTSLVTRLDKDTVTSLTE
jgi:endoglucanase